MTDCPTDPSVLTCAQARQRLCDAENAFDKLMIGGQVQSVTYGDQSVSYSKSDIGNLERYIYMLRGRVDTACGTCTRPRRTAIQFIPY